jgi:uncharacterized protein (DUF983 family)
MKKKGLGWRILGRGFRCRCPNCGQGRTFGKWFQDQEQCSVCGIRYVKDPIDAGAFLYFSTATITGFFLFGYFLIGFPSGWKQRTAVGVAGILIILATRPVRWSLAITIDYLSELFLNPDSELRPWP